jgi:hypothetical protein
MSWWNDVIIAVGGGPVAGGIISGTATLLAATLVTWRLNRGIKRTEFVLEFTKRFSDIMSRKHKLLIEPPATDELNDKEAKEIYRLLFGLMFDEHYAYKRRFLERDLYTHWMK